MTDELKQEHLRQRTLAYMRVLEEIGKSEYAVHLVRENFQPLFAAILAGEVRAPAEGVYESPFFLDIAPYYAPGTPLLSAQAEFISALEDWPSKPWYQKLLADKRGEET
jgi:hypothetical protein